MTSSVLSSVLGRVVTFAVATAFMGIGGCGTPDRMAKTYDQGKFVEAAIAGDELFPVLRDEDGMVTGIGVDAERDRLWIGLEKAKILGDAARFDESLEVFTHVYDEQLWLADCESSYAENPINPANWDIGQFFEDSGQLVVGADQTTYLVQPYEAILAASYASLDAMMTGDPRAYEFARQSMTLQGQWQENLGLEAVGVRTAPADSIGKSVSEAEFEIPGFSLTQLLQELIALLNLDEFGKARDRMNAVVSAADQVGVASPFLPAASLLNWAAFVKADQQPDAISAMEGFKAFSADVELAKGLEEAMHSSEAPDKVLVFVGGGRGPSRDYFSIRVPIVIPSLGSGYFRGVYPVLNFRDDASRPRRVLADGQALSVVGSVDAVAAQDFSRREPTLWWTPTVRGLIRVAATVAAQAATGEQDSWIGLAIQGAAAGAGVFVAEAEKADLRMWTSLPATYFAALVDRPDDGVLSIEIVADSGTNTVTVEVPKGLSLAYVRSLQPSLTVAHATSIRPGRDEIIESDPSEAAEAEEASSIDAVVIEVDSLGDLVETYAGSLHSRRLSMGQASTMEEARQLALQSLESGPVEEPKVSAGTRELGPIVPTGEHVITIAAPHDRHAFVKVVAEDGSGRSTPLFVPMSRRANVRVVPGEYSVLVATGRDWYGWQFDFGPDATYFAASPRLVVEPGGSDTAMMISLGHPEFESDYHLSQPTAGSFELVELSREQFTRP